MSATPTHRTASIYSAALHELRSNHLTEFESIYERLLKEAGITLLSDASSQSKQLILRTIKEQSGQGIGPTWLSKNLEMPISSVVKWLRELTADGFVISLGVGKRDGYVFVKDVA